MTATEWTLRRCGLRTVLAPASGSPMLLSPHMILVARQSSPRDSINAFPTFSNDCTGSSAHYLDSSQIWVCSSSSASSLNCRIVWEAFKNTGHGATTPMASRGCTAHAEDPSSCLNIHIRLVTTVYHSNPLLDSEGTASKGTIPTPPPLTPCPHTGTGEMDGSVVRNNG